MGELGWPGDASFCIVLDDSHEVGDFAPAGPRGSTSGAVVDRQEKNNPECNDGVGEDEDADERRKNHRSTQLRKQKAGRARPRRKTMARPKVLLLLTTKTTTAGGAKRRERGGRQLWSRTQVPPRLFFF